MPFLAIYITIVLSLDRSTPTPYRIDPKSIMVMMPEECSYNGNKECTRIHTIGSSSYVAIGSPDEINKSIIGQIKQQYTEILK